MIFLDTVARRQVYELELYDKAYLESYLSIALVKYLTGSSLKKERLTVVQGWRRCFVHGGESMRKEEQWLFTLNLPLRSRE